MQLRKGLARLARVADRSDPSIASSPASRERMLSQVTGLQLAFARAGTTCRERMCSEDARGWARFVRIYRPLADDWVGYDNFAAGHQGTGCTTNASVPAMNTVLPSGVMAMYSG